MIAIENMGSDHAWMMMPDAAAHEVGIPGYTLCDSLGSYVYLPSESPVTNHLFSFVCYFIN